MHILSSSYLSTQQGQAAEKKRENKYQRENYNIESIKNCF